jgi:hypothetical protein
VGCRIMPPLDLQVRSTKSASCRVFGNWTFIPECAGRLYGDKAAEVACDMAGESSAGWGQVVRS